MRKIYIIFVGMFLAGCYAPQKTVAPAAQQSNIIIDGKLYTSVFQQRAAEYKALCIQAYNIARMRVEEIPLTPSHRELAIITDIDETILDNSPYAVKRALEGKSYDQASWSDWTKRALCDTLAGSLSFFKFAADRNIEIYYISNRLEEEREGTLKNLQKFGFPNADNNHLLLKVDTSSKQARRKMIAGTHDIVLFLGDNMADFSPLFDDKKSTVERSDAVLQNAEEFGKKFIVLPNSNYGDWEGAIYNYHYGFTPAQKDSAVRANLRGY